MAQAETQKQSVGLQLGSRVPFNRPTRVIGDVDSLVGAFANGQISSTGPATREAERFLADAVGVPQALLTTSCTHALELAALLLEVREGDEVIVPSFTFTSTATAFALRGAQIRFVDITPDTLNIDPKAVAAAVTDRTKVIVPVHYGGVGCDMEALLGLAGERGIAVVEDNAHGLFGSLDGKPLGSFGAMSSASFHETKNFTMGEGGALFIQDEKLAARAEVLRDKGTNRAAFFKGMVDKYTWVDHGSSFGPSELLAALLLAQLKQREQLQHQRCEAWYRYQHELAAWSAANHVVLPRVPVGASHTAHVFQVLLPSESDRDAFILHLRELGIQAVFHYQPLHASPMGRMFGEASCPVATEVSSRLVRLPLFSNITSQEQAAVIDAALSFECETVPAAGDLLWAAVA